MTPLPDLDGFLAEVRERADAALAEWLPPGTDSPASLHEAMRYAVLSGGKRLRPALAFAAARALATDPARVTPVATAVELVHAYSLVHDDLPAMDDDAERRGRPTVHVKFGEGIAILVGDALLTSAFERLAAPDVPPDCIGPLVLALARAAGSRALVGGQADDLYPPSEPERAAILSIHERKTAALFGFALTGAARLVGADAAQVRALAAFGLEYGLAFQAADDLADAGRDETSLLRVVSPQELSRHLEERVAGCRAALEPLGAEADLLRALALRLWSQTR